MKVHYDGNHWIIDLPFTDWPTIQNIKDWCLASRVEVIITFEVAALIHIHPDGTIQVEGLVVNLYSEEDAVLFKMRWEGQL